MTTISQLLLTFLLNACWQITLITVVAAGCAWLLHEAPVRYRHRIWTWALALSLGLSILATSELINRSGVNRSWLANDQVTVTTTDAVVRTNRHRTTNRSLPGPITGAQENRPIHLNSNLASLLLFSYGLFLSYRLVRFILAWSRTSAIRRAALSDPAPETSLPVIENCRKTLGVSKPRIVFSSSLPLPITLGIFRPLIIVPERLLTDNSDLLRSAVGHELAHVLRRDYLLNLVYELLYLPISFHPAAALLRRKINETRELCCDELVANRLLTPQLYARSLVQLAGSAPGLGLPAATTTLGITDANILEVRVMTLLRKSNTAGRGRKLLFIAASLLLLIPCVAAAALALRFDMDSQVPGLYLRDTPPYGIAGQEEAKAKRIYSPEPEYTEDAREKKIEGTVGLLVTIGGDGLVREIQVTKPLYGSLDESAVKTVRTWRFEPATKDGLPLTRQLSLEINFTLDSSRRNEAREREEQELRERAEREGKVELKTDSSETRVRREREEREMEAKQQVELARLAKITMDQAIQIATSQYPGKVLECSLVGERWEAAGKLAKDGQVFYHVVILSGDDSARHTHVLISAIDGRVIKVEKEENRKEEPDKELR